MSLSPELIKAPSSPMASPIRAPAAAAAPAEAADAAPAAAAAPAFRHFRDDILTFDQPGFLLDQEQDERDAREAKKTEEAAAAAVRHSAASESKSGGGGGGGGAAAAAAAASDSKSGGGGGGDRAVTGTVGSNPSILLKDIYAKLRLDLWTGPPVFLFQVVPYSGNYKDIKELESELTTLCEAVIAKLADNEKDSDGDDDLGEFSEYLNEHLEEAEHDNRFYRVMKNALEDLVEFLEAYCSLAKIDCHMSSDKFHEICADVALMEITTDSEGEAPMPAAPAAAAAAADAKVDAPPKRPAPKLDDGDDKERPAKRRKVPTPVTESDNEDDERSSAAARKDMDDRE